MVPLPHRNEVFVMALKDIAKRIGNIAFRLATSSCGGDCGKCGICQNSSRLMPLNERQSHGKGNSGGIAKFGGEGINLKRVRK